MPSFNIPIGQAFHSLGQGIVAHPAVAVSVAAVAVCSAVVAVIGPHLTLTFGGAPHIDWHAAPQGKAGLFGRLIRAFRRRPSAYVTSTSA